MHGHPHLGVPPLQLAAGQAALAGGGEEALGVRARGRRGLRRHRTQLAALAEPAEGDDVRVEVGRVHRQGDGVWEEEEEDGSQGQIKEAQRSTQRSLQGRNCGSTFGGPA